MTRFVETPAYDLTSRADPENPDASRYDEVWDGVCLVSPLANPEHQELAVRLCMAIAGVLNLDGGDRLYAGVNVSDRDEEWSQNYRIPDVAVVLNGGRARRREAHVQGGPDFLVEILSRNDRAREKLDFYGSVGVRELLVVDRAPWALELYRLRDGRLSPVSRTTEESPAGCASEVLPLTFRLTPGDDRPVITISAHDGPRVWTA